MDQADYRDLRERMVDEQIALRGITDPRVLSAMRKVPRHLFVDEDLAPHAYSDMALPIGGSQTISQPYMVAVMSQLLDLKGDERVLEIGTGSGYQAAVLAELAAEVYTIERIPSLAQLARLRFLSLAYDRIHTRSGDGSLGWPEKAPFDRVIITAASPAIPEPLIAQLSTGGILVSPVGTRFSQQLVKVYKTPSGLVQEYHTPCVFVPLIGEFGWKEGS